MEGLKEMSAEEAIAEWTERRIKDQRKQFKDSKKSLCQNCTKLNEDCFEYMKYCEPDKLGWSTVTKCTGFINKNPREWE